MSRPAPDVAATAAAAEEEWAALLADAQRAEPSHCLPAMDWMWPAWGPLVGDRPHDWLPSPP